MNKISKRKLENRKRAVQFYKSRTQELLKVFEFPISKDLVEREYFSIKFLEMLNISYIKDLLKPEMSMKPSFNLLLSVDLQETKKKKMWKNFMWPEGKVNGTSGLQN